MFQREQPTPSDPNMAHFYGLALPLLKRGLPVTPVQLENVTLPGFLDTQRVLLLSYTGQKPLSADVHIALAAWVRKGGVLVFIDDDKDPYNHVREWWNADGTADRIPRQHLFEALGLKAESFVEDQNEFVAVGEGGLIWLRENSARFALSVQADARLASVIKLAAEKAHLAWRETNYLALRRGPFLVAAGLDESLPGEPKNLKGRFINLFDPELKVVRSLQITPGARLFLRDLEAPNAPASSEPHLLACACKALPTAPIDGAPTWTVEGVGNTPAVMLLSSPTPPRSVLLDQQPLETFTYDPTEKLLYLHFPNEPSPRSLTIHY
jgi:hypothetical protein